MADTWTKQTEWMREQGATAATWAVPPNGGEIMLVSVILGPAPRAAATIETQHTEPGDEPAETAQPRTNPHVSGLVKAGPPLVDRHR